MGKVMICQRKRQERKENKQIISTLLGCVVLLVGLDYLLHGPWV